MKSFNVVKLDARMNGYRTFSHRLDFMPAAPSDTENLHNMRVWLWETYGPGSELSIVKETRVSWAWDTEHGNCRVYVSPEILSMIQLRSS